MFDNRGVLTHTPVGEDEGSMRLRACTAFIGY